MRQPSSSPAPGPRSPCTKGTRARPSRQCPILIPKIGLPISAVGLIPQIVKLDFLLGAQAKLVITLMSYEGKNQGAWRISGAAAFAMDAIRPPMKEATFRRAASKASVISAERA